MTQNYSRLAEIEKKKNTRTAVVYGGLSVLFIVFLVVFGIKLVSQAAGLAGNGERIGNGNVDNTPPAPPRVNYLPEFTNKSELIVDGTAEAGSVILVAFNDESKEVVTNADGTFTTTINLEKGENILLFKATDQAGNESASSSQSSVTYDEEKPKVEITNPKDGAKFYGSNQKKINIEGTTESTASVTINDRVVAVNPDGKFVYSVELGDGENNFNIKSTDQAGNQTEMDVKYSYSP